MLAGERALTNFFKLFSVTRKLLRAADGKKKNLRHSQYSLIYCATARFRLFTRAYYMRYLTRG